MKYPKYLSSLLTIFAAISLTFTACDNDDENTFAAPKINLTEVEIDNSLQCSPGHDLHLEADIVAEGSIKRIDIEIHQEEEGSFEIEKSYTEGKYIGVRNTEFHEHIDIPQDAPLGSYHLHFIVTDQKGQQTTAECELEMVEDNGEEANHHH